MSGASRSRGNDAPAAVATGFSRIDHFARGSSGHLIHGWYQGVIQQKWSEIDSLPIRSAPAVVSAYTAEKGRVDVFVRGEDDLLKHRIYLTAPEGPTETLYTVVRGDYMLKIARKFGMPLQALKDLNPQVKPPRYIIHPGDRLVAADHDAHLARAARALHLGAGHLERHRGICRCRERGGEHHASDQQVSARDRARPVHLDKIPARPAAVQGARGKGGVARTSAVESPASCPEA